MKAKYFLFFAIIFLLYSCASVKYQTFKRLTVEANEHQFKPASHALYFSAPDKFYQIWFDSSAAVVHPLDKENDWNKGEGGISWGLFTHHKNSIMWAWRWNVAFQHFELTWYAHIDGVRKFGLPMSAVQPNELFNVEIKEIQKGVWRVLFETNLSTPRNANDTIYEAQTMVVPFVAYADIQVGKSRTVSKNIPAWWGGNYPAPRRAYMFVKSLK